MRTRRAAPSPRLPVFSIERIGDAPPQPLPAGDRPLVGRARARSHARHRRAGVRAHARGARRRRAAGHRRAPAADDAAGDRQRARQALDLHRPARGRAGAKRSQRLAARRRHLRAGLSARRRRRQTASAPSEAARLRPGIVYVSLCAYGHEGPWANRRGFDSLVQNANGINHAEAEAAGAAQPKPLPCQAIDHASGYLMAFGAMTALARRVTEGGSWHVRVSLAQTGHWIRGLGRVPDGLACPDPELRRRARPARGKRFRLRPPHHRAPRRHDVGDAAALGAAVGAARHACGGLAYELSSRPSASAARPREPGSMNTNRAIEASSGGHGVPRRPSVARDDGERRRSAAIRRPRCRSSCARPAARTGRARARSSSDIGRNRAIIAAIATSAARVAPSSHLSAMPMPCSGNAPQNTPSAPVFTSTRAPNRFMISLQKRPCRRRNRAAPRRPRGCARRPWRALAPRPLPGAEARERVRQRGQRHRPGRDRAAVDAADIGAERRRR